MFDIINKYWLIKALQRREFMSKIVFLVAVSAVLTACGTDFTVMNQYPQQPPTAEAIVAPSSPVPVPGLSCDSYDLLLVKPTVLPTYNTAPSQTVSLGGRYVDTYLLETGLNFESAAAMLTGSTLRAEEWFGIDCRAKFTAVAGQYVFRLTAKDGAKLFIDGVLVVNNDGLHASQLRTGSMLLSAGDHSLRLQYFNSTGTASLKLESSVPILLKQ